MFARLLFSLALALVMMRPRPYGPSSMPPHQPPDSGGDEPPTYDPRQSNPFPAPLPRPTLPDDSQVPNVPPTPPPGYEGTWPPGGDTPSTPPTAPPGEERGWPPRFERASLIDRLLDIIRELRRAPLDGSDLRDARRSAHAVGSDADTAEA